MSYTTLGQILDGAKMGDSFVPSWLIIALSDADLEEVPGPQHNPRIVAMAQTCTLQARDDETPWCSEAMNFWIEQAGLQGTKSAAAKSWATWGVEIDAPRLGCIVVLSRPGGNHVGLYMGEDDAGVYLWGGNQADKVCLRHFPWAAVDYYRWPWEEE